MIGTGILGYTGPFLDPVTETYPLGNGYRIYLPWLMRFNAPDSDSPFGPGGINSYAYCMGDPINSTDPTGHAPPESLEEDLVDLDNEVEAELNDNRPLSQDASNIDPGHPLQDVGHDATAQPGPSTGLSQGLADLVNGAYDKVHNKIFAEQHAKTLSEERAKRFAEERAKEGDPYNPLPLPDPGASIDELLSTYNNAFDRGHIEINYAGGNEPTVLLYWRAQFVKDGVHLKYDDKQVNRVMHLFGFVGGRIRHVVKMPEDLKKVPRDIIIDRLLNRDLATGRFRPPIMRETSTVNTNASRQYRKNELFKKLRRVWML